MNFPFDAEKAAEAAMFFLHSEKREKTILKLVKLLYLAERESIELRDVPIFGGTYFSLPHGPVVSEPYDLMNGKGSDADLAKWNYLIRERQGKHMEEKIWREPEALSDAEMSILEDVQRRHATKSAWQLRDWCHKNIPEYEELESGNRPIKMQTLVKEVKADAEAVSEEANLSAFFKNVFAS